jgi:hypothetical protein
MSAKKAVTYSRKVGADKQRGNSAKKAKNRPTGKPFGKGNPHAFKPGQSGNPAGRPKSRTLSEAYRAWLSQPSEKDPARTNADALAEVVGRAALKGDLFAVREITDRVEGRPRQAIDLSIDEKKRELVNNAIAQLQAEAEIERDEAVERLKAITPEISEWVN